MDFEICSEEDRKLARLIWYAATMAERARCAGIAKKVGNLHLSRSEWLECSEKIYEEIVNT